MEMGEEGDYVPIATLSPPECDSCIETGSDESHFTVSLIVRDTVTRQCLQTTNVSKRKENRTGIEPKPFCLPA